MLKKEAKGHKMMQYAIDTTNRVVSEMNMLNTLVEPLGNIGIQGTDFMGQTVSSVASMMTNDNYEMLDAANSIFCTSKRFTSYRLKITPLPDESDRGVCCFNFVSFHPEAAIFFSTNYLVDPILQPSDSLF